VSPGIAICSRPRSAKVGSGKVFPHETPKDLGGKFPPSPVCSAFRKYPIVKEDGQKPWPLADGNPGGGGKRAQPLVSTEARTWVSEVRGAICLPAIRCCDAGKILASGPLSVRCPPLEARIRLCGKVRSPFFFPFRKKRTAGAHNLRNSGHAGRLGPRPPGIIAKMRPHRGSKPPRRAAGGPLRKTNMLNMAKAVVGREQRPGWFPAPAGQSKPKEVKHLRPERLWVPPRVRGEPSPGPVELRGPRERKPWASPLRSG